MEGSTFQELNKKSSNLICQKEELERHKKLLTKKKSAAIVKTAKTNSDSEFQTPNRPHIDLDEVSFIILKWLINVIFTFFAYDSMIDYKYSHGDLRVQSKSGFFLPQDFFLSGFFCPFGRASRGSRKTISNVQSKSYFLQREFIRIGFSCQSIKEIPVLYYFQ